MALAHALLLNCRVQRECCCLMAMTVHLKQQRYLIRQYRLLSPTGHVLAVVWILAGATSGRRKGPWSVFCIFCVGEQRRGPLSHSRHMVLARRPVMAPLLSSFRLTPDTSCVPFIQSSHVNMLSVKPSWFLQPSPCSPHSSCMRFTTWGTL